jgi:hypothetical protein
MRRLLTLLFALSAVAGVTGACSSDAQQEQTTTRPAWNGSTAAVITDEDRFRIDDANRMHDLSQNQSPAK